MSGFLLPVCRAIRPDRAGADASFGAVFGAIPAWQRDRVFCDGQRAGPEPPYVILIILIVWASLWGIAGAIVSIPITAVIMIVLSGFPGARPIVVLLSRSGGPGSVQPGLLDEDVVSTKVE